MWGMVRVAHAVVALTVVVAGLAGCADDGPGAPAPPASPAAGSGPAAMLAELPVPRTEVAGATWQGAPVVAGGLTADGAASDLVHTFDLRAGRWLPAPALPVPLHHAGMATLGDRVYVAGGYTNGPGQPWVPLADVRSLGPGERNWRDEAPLPGGARGALGLAATAGALVAAGGEAGGQALARTEVFDAARRAWRPGPDLARAREHLALAARGGRVYAIAGRTPAGGNLAVVESIDPAGPAGWRKEPGLGDSRGGIGAATVEGRLCVAGGEEAAGTIASVECLDGDRWTRAVPLAHPRHGLAVMAVAGRLHAVAGGEQPGLFVSGLHEAVDV